MWIREPCWQQGGYVELRVVACARAQGSTLHKDIVIACARVTLGVNISRAASSEYGISMFFSSSAAVHWMTSVIETAWELQLVGGDRGGERWRHRLD